MTGSALPPLLSSDGHLEVRPERWTPRMPARLREGAPRTITLPAGGDAILIEGQPPYPVPFLDLRAGRTNETWQPFGVTVEDTAGTVLATLARYSNLDSSAGYVQKTFDVAAFKGRTVVIHFHGVEDFFLPTSFLVDDASHDDTIAEAPGVALLGHAYWRSRFGSDPDVVGRSIRVGGAPAEGGPTTKTSKVPAGSRCPPRAAPTSANSTRVRARARRMRSSALFDCARPRWVSWG